MPSYARHLTRPTQRNPIFGRDQVKNAASGYVFSIDPFEALDRFLILGCEGGTYYTGESEMTQSAALNIIKCASLDLQRTVKAIVDASNGKAIKNDTAVFALAVLAGQVNNGSSYVPGASALALSHLNDVCRIGTHLFNFVGEVTQFRGWGRGLRNAVASWYTSKTPQDLLYQVTKYQQRNGWSHRDLLRLSHPASDELDPVFKYVAGGDPFDDKVQKLSNDELAYIGAIETVKRASSENLVIRMITEHNLVREHIPTKWFDSPRVWEALLARMPYTALIRNLGKMTNVGLLTPMSDATKFVCSKLRAAEQLRRARVHPFTVLLAQTTYATGRGVRGSLTWVPDSDIVDALDDAFYNAFDTVEPAGKNFMLGIDVSGSMGCRGFTDMGSIAGTHLKAFHAAAAMAMVQLKTEPWCFPVAFSGNLWRSGSKLQPLSTLSRKRRLSSVMDELLKIPVGPTDCSAPMRYATENNLPVDVFVVYTDNETWYGDVHPSQALEDYRQASGRDAKLVVCAMTATHYSIADPSDPGMLDVVGFDASCPAAISKFARM